MNQQSKNLQTINFKTETKIYKKKHQLAQKKKFLPYMTKP